jgi:hypothetical protein
MNIFYSQVDGAVQTELNARGNSGKNRTSRDIDFMVGKLANVQISAYNSGSADPQNLIAEPYGTLGGTKLTTGRYMPSGEGGFLTEPTYIVTSIDTNKAGQAVLKQDKKTDTSRRIGPYITQVSIDIGDHSMGLLNKATFNITIPNPTRDLDGIENTWFYPGRYVKLEIVHPETAIISGIDNRLSTESLFGSLSQEDYDGKLKKMYPSLVNELDKFKNEIRQLNLFSFQGLVTSFDFSYTEDGTVEATISLTGTSNTYTDVSMLMNPETKTVTPKDVNYTFATSSTAELSEQKIDTGSIEFYGQLYHQFEKVRNQYKLDENITNDPPVLIPFPPPPPPPNDKRTPDPKEKRDDSFILYGQMYPNTITWPNYPAFVLDASSSLNQASQQQEYDKKKTAYDKRNQSFTTTQRYVTLGGLIQFVNTYITKKLKDSAVTSTIVCDDLLCFSNYYQSLTSCVPDQILLLPVNTPKYGFNVYPTSDTDALIFYPTVVQKMASKTNIPQWPGVYSTTANQEKIYPSRIFLNLEYIQQVLNALSETNTKQFTLKTFLANISARISYATGGAIDLKLVTDNTNTNILNFMDTKYLKSIDPTKKVEPYSVPMLANHENGTIVRAFTFQAKLPANVKNLSYVLNSGTNVSESEIAPYLNFMYNSKDVGAINAAKLKYKEKHQTVLKNLTEAKTSYGLIPFSQENTTKLYKALVEYVKFPYDDIMQSQQMTAPVFPFDVDFEIDGINGLRYGDVLTFDGLPEKYKNNTVFSIIGITHDVSTDGVWTTKIKCIMRPNIG